MSEMNELSEMYEESNDLQMDMEVGGGSREPSPNPSRPMEEEAALPMVEPQGDRGLAHRPGEQPGQLASPDFKSEDDYDYLEEEQLSGAGYRVSAVLEEANKMFLRTSRAREAALDGGFQMHYEKTPFDQLAFIEELFSLMVVNRLTKELSCDEIIDRNEEETY
uniref:EP300 interacting inhibitor of differentiation 1 n=1 Tax=Canis lupus familiaris TaxID=9615 RepID=A0A8P0NWL4_CANLF